MSESAIVSDGSGSWLGSSMRGEKEGEVPELVALVVADFFVSVDLVGRLEGSGVVEVVLVVVVVVVVREGGGEGGGGGFKVVGAEALPIDFLGSGGSFRFSCFINSLAIHSSSFLLSSSSSSRLHSSSCVVLEISRLT